MNISIEIFDWNQLNKIDFFDDDELNDIFLKTDIDCLKIIEIRRIIEIFQQTNVNETIETKFSFFDIDEILRSNVHF